MSLAAASLPPRIFGRPGIAWAIPRPTAVSLLRFTGLASAQGQRIKRHGPSRFLDVAQYSDLSGPRNFERNQGKPGIAARLCNKGRPAWQIRKKPDKQFPFKIDILFILGVLLAILFAREIWNTGAETIPYSQLREWLSHGAVTDVVVGQNTISGTYTPPGKTPSRRFSPPFASILRSQASLSAVTSNIPASYSRV